MTKQKLLVTLIKLAASPTKYDNKTDRWAAWIHGAWLMDCCRSIKAVLWGFDFDKKARHGGAIYKKGYPDYTTEEMIANCRNVSDKIGKNLIEPGELLWFPGHVGIYLGDGNVFECAPSVKGCAITTLSYQPWKKHGKIKEIDYLEPAPAPASPYAGEELLLKNAPLYYSSSRKEPAETISGKRYVFDGKIVRGRIRICRTPEDIARGMNGVEGWIDWKEEKK